MGGSVSRYPDGQLAMPVFDNGGSQASSDAMQFSRFSVCRLGLILFTVTNCIYFFMVAVASSNSSPMQSVIYYFFKTFEPLRFHRVNWRSHRSEWLIPAYLFSMPFMAS